MTTEAPRQLRGPRDALGLVHRAPHRPQDAQWMIADAPLPAVRSIIFRIGNSAFSQRRPRWTHRSSGNCSVQVPRRAGQWVSGRDSRAGRLALRARGHFGCSKRARSQRMRPDVDVAGLGHQAEHVASGAPQPLGETRRCQGAPRSSTLLLNVFRSVATGTGAAARSGRACDVEPPAAAGARGSCGESASRRRSRSGLHDPPGQSA